MNAPDRFELFLLPDGVAKVSIVPDQRVPNASIIKFEREDHTLGNMLTAQLLQDPKVVNAAYKVEHPLFANFVMRVQTDEGYTPREAIKTASSALIGQISVLAHKFRTDYSYKAVLAEEE